MSISTNGGNVRKRVPQHLRLLEYLRVRGSITTLEAFDQLRITKVSNRIGDLEAMGYDIAREPETRNGATYTRYFLEQTEMF